MKERTIIFPFDDADVIGEKVLRIERLIGKENVNTDGLDYKIPEILVRCSDNEWKNIKFICDLTKCWY